MNRDRHGWKKERDWRDYVPPNARLKTASEDSENLDKYAMNLRKRLNMAHTYTNETSVLPSSPPTYAQKVENKNEHVITPSRNAANQLQNPQQHTIITVPTTEPSTLTNMEEQQRKMQEQIDRQGQQMENMLTRINQMMDTMQQMFSTMSTLLLKVLPDTNTPTELLKFSRPEQNSPLQSTKSIPGGYLSTVSPMARVL